jgi:hypothetical protein
MKTAALGTAATLHRRSTLYHGRLDHRNCRLAPRSVPHNSRRLFVVGARRWSCVAGCGVSAARSKRSLARRVDAENIPFARMRVSLTIRARDRPALRKGNHSIVLSRHSRRGRRRRASSRRGSTSRFDGARRISRRLRSLAHQGHRRLWHASSQPVRRARAWPVASASGRHGRTCRSHVGSRGPIASASAHREEKSGTAIASVRGPALGKAYARGAARSRGSARGASHSASQHPSSRTGVNEAPVRVPRSVRRHREARATGRMA